MRKRTKKYVPSPGPPQGHVSQQGRPSPVEAPETFWQGQTCSWLTKKSTGPTRWAPRWVKFNAGGTFSLRIPACLCYAHPHPCRGRDWWSPPEALASSTSGADLISAPLENGVSIYAKGKSIKATSQVTDSYMLITAAQLPAELGVGAGTGLPNILGVPGGAEPQPRGPRRGRSAWVWGAEAVPLHLRPSGERSVHLGSARA